MLCSEFLAKRGDEDFGPLIVELRDALHQHIEHKPTERVKQHYDEGSETTMSKVWIITGAGRGMGVAIAKAALAAGHKVVATGRNPDKVAQALGTIHKAADCEAGHYQTRRR